MSMKRWTGVASSLLFVVAMGCGDVKEGTVQNSIALPADSSLTLYSANEGIHPDTSILQDPANPYARVSVDESNKWRLDNTSPSPKSKFYLWATALANIPTGENQFKTAEALHALYGQGGSVNAREQAIKAYRSVLDNFFNSATYFNATYLPGNPAYPVPLKDLVGQNLYAPSDLVPLYSNPTLAAVDMGQWGYAVVVVLDYKRDINGNIIYSSPGVPQTEQKVTVDKIQ
jgi:hypothetical protein